MDRDVRDFLVEAYGPQGLPFTTLFGNGQPVGPDIVELIGEVYAAHTMREAWRPGDLLLVDNLRCAHSRDAFEGQREVLVGMAEPVRDGSGNEAGMSTPATPPPFAVVSGAQVQRALAGREREIVDLVEATYRWHGAGDSVNPPSYFLRFPDRPTARIIALPASLGGKVRVDGLKWISSFPGQRGRGHPARLGRADPQRPRHRLPVRLPGELDHQCPPAPPRPRHSERNG